MILQVDHEGHPHPDALVYFIFEGGNLPLELPLEAAAAAKRPEFGGKLGQVADCFPPDGPRIVLVGLGPEEGRSVLSVHKAALKLSQYVNRAEVDATLVTVPDSLATAYWGQIVGVALKLSSFSAKQFPGTRTPSDTAVRFSIKSMQEDFDKGLGRGIGIGDAVNFCRRMVGTPPNIATPSWMAEEARQLTDRVTGLTLRVLQGQDLIDERLAGLTTVGRASASPPCLIRLEWNPPTATGQKPVVLLGKTITYDTGGLSIKGKLAMPGMKHDKAGGCAVLATMQAVAEVIQPPFPVVALLTAAENAVDANSVRPDDVITYRNGVTVEITNTDAEGRLVLADGLCWACDEEDPDCIVDIATLTGAVVTALGCVYGGLFSEAPALVSELVEAGTRSGEEVWQLPVNDAYREMMKGTVADLVNSNPSGMGPSSMAAAFLTCFCQPQIPYAHIDMAGLASSKRDDFTTEGPSGWGVRLLTEFLTSRCGAN